MRSIVLLLVLIFAVLQGTARAEGEVKIQIASFSTFLTGHTASMTPADWTRVREGMGGGPKTIKCAVGNDYSKCYCTTSDGLPGRVVTGDLGMSEEMAALLGMKIPTKCVQIESWMLPMMPH